MKNFYIKSCYYYRSDDQAIDIYSPSSDTKILIESTYFKQCSTNANYPCVSVGDRGNFVQNRVCYVQCKGGDKGELISSQTDFYQLNFNKIFESTILYNGHNNSNNPALYFCNGIIQISKVNISHNFNKVNSGYFMYNYHPESIINYTNIDNNTQTEGHVAVHIETPFKLLTDIVLHIFSCNYIRNTGRSSIFYTEINGIISIEQSCIADNNVNHTFYIQSGNVLLDSSYCDSNTTFNKNKPQIMNQLENYSEISNQFQLQSACEVKIDKII
ncbi:hypothetical protein TVAG_302870 [Trichomonas vaginalis G3]|uniref:Uncharacterized protein n=1 Tax=Trichomonas vaginalis (strain ATCC PRA-98 / G3) TaxID=412133 RepID=A2FPM3_TRIV3|nr:hypothetical protein TVAGG3_0880370 [Trichomonas vaginalis G3]EAX93147.1 hypothetical protein TVAG_302870 [Trichomonas vaginalis G3]KAI5502007.1 hypothetical protein TVAGG3_0880370 [Trichomonas vaginalis G3]|eukprot:XP_001306077.1 hypothetical protein [Trichomonas vaginalis G3]